MTERENQPVAPSDPVDLSLTTPEIDPGTYPIAVADPADFPYLWVHRNHDSEDEFWVVHKGFQRIGPQQDDTKLLIASYVPFSEKRIDGGSLQFQGVVIGNSTLHGRPQAPDSGDLAHALYSPETGASNQSGTHGLFKPGVYKVAHESNCDPVAFVWRVSESLMVERWELLGSTESGPKFVRASPTNPRVELHFSPVSGVVPTSAQNFHDWAEGQFRTAYEDPNAQSIFHHMQYTWAPWSQ